MCSNSKGVLKSSRLSSIRQGGVQVVLLLPTVLSTRIKLGDFLKSCDGGITRSSSVFLGLKDLRAER